MSESGDKLSSSTISDLNTKLDSAHNSDQDNLISKIQKILEMLPSSGDDEKAKVNDIQQIKEDAVHIDPDNLMPQEALTAIKQGLQLHDDIMRQVDALLSKLPMLQEFIEELNESITLLVMNAVEPYIVPFVSKVVRFDGYKAIRLALTSSFQTSGLSEGTDALLSGQDQTKIFNDAVSLPSRVKPPEIEHLKHSNDL